MRDFTLSYAKRISRCGARVCLEHSVFGSGDRYMLSDLMFYHMPIRAGAISCTYIIRVYIYIYIYIFIMCIFII